MASFGLVILAVVLTDVLHLHPCHLCILQRLLFMVLGLFALFAALFMPRLAGRLGGSLALIAAATGIVVASYQVWLQTHSNPFSCTSGTPVVVERLIDWLGGLMPSMFLATGLCQEVELRILTLSMPEWALIAFTAMLVIGGLALRAGKR